MQLDQAKEKGQRYSWKRLLAPQRLRASHTSHEVGDRRNAFQQDQHRILLSASFRRLQDKTQVFPLERSDFVRTRLTHSLEVASLARSLGHMAGHLLCERGLAPELEFADVQAMGDLLYCAGLVHDIGNPPFGHYGETSIREAFRDHMQRLQYRQRPLTAWLSSAQQADFLHFEGNAEALRVLSKLHFVVDEHGMNLTLPLLASLIKYPVPSSRVDPEHPAVMYHKAGWFQAEEDLVARIHEATGLGLGQRHPLTWLLEAADDISYGTADIEDGYKKNFFSYEDLLQDLAEFEPKWSHDGLALSAPSILASKQAARYAEELAQLKNIWQKAQDLKQTEAVGAFVTPGLYAIQNWLIALQSRLIREVAELFVQQEGAIMTGEWATPLLAQCPSGAVLEALSQIAAKRIFRSRPIVQIEISAHTVISGILEQLLPAAVTWEEEAPSSLEPRLMSLVSENFRAQYRYAARGQDEAQRLYLRLLLVTDYVSGMTDSYAFSLFQQLKGIRSPKLFSN